MEEMGPPVTDERYENVIFRVLTAEYEMVRTASCEKRGVDLADIQHVVSTRYVDYLFCPNVVNLAQAAALPRRQLEEVTAVERASSNVSFAGSEVT